MGTKSSILAWKLPWTEELGATVHGITKSRTQLSMHVYIGMNIHKFIYTLSEGLIVSNISISFVVNIFVDFVFLNLIFSPEAESPSQRLLIFFFYKIKSLIKEKKRK